jgi:hypothetical protein
MGVVLERLRWARADGAIVRGGLLFALACLFVACSLDQSPGSGGLVVLVDSDMAVPKDIDQITVDVTQSGNSLKHDEQQFTQGRVMLPWEVIVPRTDDHSPATIRVVAFKEGRTRVVREAITTIPTSYLGMLRMAVNYLCDGMVDGAGASTCGLGQTCIQGSCAAETLTMDPAPYGALDMTTLAAVRSADAGVPMCFPISSCFNDATEVTPDPTTCAFVPPSLFGDHMNVALRLDLGSPGVCDDTACWVVLDSGDDGWRIVNGQVVLPKNICERRNQGTNLRVAVSQLCSPKTAVMPACANDATGVVIPGQSSPITNVTTAQGVLPAVGDACNGAGTRSCGMCGKSDRMCQNGLWSSYGECTNEGECKQNQNETCGNSGMRTCGGDCTWGRCESQRCEGQATRVCGNCGTQHRACDNGMWGEWSACEAEGECTPNATEACGAGGTRACGGNCSWGPCGMQQCPGAPSQACGNCGMQMRTCDGGTATWSAWGPCEGEGVCAQNATQSCGMNGTQTCGGKCQWDVACTGQTCSGAAAEACGNCGTRTRICDMNTGEWSEWSACLGEGACSPDTTRACGATGTGTQSCAGNCQWDDACTGQKCVGASVEGCGLCGTRTRTCNTNDGTWSGWSACSNEGDCSPGTTRTCGSGGTQTCTTLCKWPAACPGQNCDSQGPASRACGNCGTQTRTCNVNTGSYGAWSDCSEPVGACKPNDQRTCGGNSHQTCGLTCQWDTTCQCNGTLSACPGADGTTACVNTKNNSANCGECGNVCTGGSTCKAGSCQCTGTQTLCHGTCMSTTTNGNCGACDITCSGGTQCNGTACVCPAGEIDCGGICKNVLGSDTTNCGACGTTCDTGQMCVKGVCMLVCGGSTPNACDGRCTNLQSDGNNCGRCGNPCARGETCMNGVCCASGEVLCGGQCTDTRLDPANCGACGAPCPAGQMCMGGTCALVCTGGTTNCSGVCSDLRSDAKHCGRCDVSCGRGQSCSGGECACASGEIFCGDACVASSDANCGSCGNACSGGAHCNGVACVCAAGQKQCGVAGCIDVMGDDPNNCGDCGATCGAGQTCRGGSCVCGAGQTACGMPPQCVDTLTNEGNCGGCGNACAPGQSCMGGACMIVCGSSAPNLCGSTCTDFQTDDKNCGGCKNSCSAGSTCKAGICTPTCGGSKPNVCGGTCVNVDSDPNNCGMCGIVCGADETCEAGACTLKCTGGTKSCNDTCVNTKTDPDNCGGCNQRCMGPQSACVNGQCACPAGQMLCDDGTCSEQCACAAGEHRCGTACVKISNSSCTAACNACPTVRNGTSSCNPDQVRRRRVQRRLLFSRPDLRVDCLHRSSAAAAATAAARWRW